jgi:hypothetical protein
MISETYRIRWAAIGTRGVIEMRDPMVSASATSGTEGASPLVVRRIISSRTSAVGGLTVTLNMNRSSWASGNG